MEIQNASTTPSKSNQLRNVNTVRWESWNVTTQPWESSKLIPNYFCFIHSAVHLYIGYVWTITIILLYAIKHFLDRWKSIFVMALRRHCSENKKKPRNCAANSIWTPVCHVLPWSCVSKVIFIEKNRIPTLRGHLTDLYSFYKLCFSTQSKIEVPRDVRNSKGP